MVKNLISGPILATLTQIRATNFFFNNLACSVTRYHGQLSSCTISEKANDTILRKLSDRETEGQINGQTRLVSQDADRLTSSVQDVCLRGVLKTFCINCDNMPFYKQFHFFILASNRKGEIPIWNLKVFLTRLSDYLFLFKKRSAISVFFS